MEGGREGGWGAGAVVEMEGGRRVRMGRQVAEGGFSKVRREGGTASGRAGGREEGTDT